MIGQRVEFWTSDPNKRLERKIGVVTDEIDPVWDWVIRTDDGVLWHVVDQDIVGLCKSDNTRCTLDLVLNPVNTRKKGT